ncbi:hypothetical protein DL98DRAFT_582889 [Cadophora sp. DSE1049]|nr:hypothetical protein DL98DRAFT_582889 [Cadophora sp. DSE1049]
MSFGWSAGDIASALKLLYTIGKALKESCGASSDFAEISSDHASTLSIARYGRNPKNLTTPRKIQWALVMPRRIEKLQGHIGGPMLAVNALMGFQALETISQFQTVMPDILKDQLEESFQQNLATGIDASVGQPLERALLEFRKVVACCEKATGDVSQSSQHISESVTIALQLFGGQHLELLTDSQQALQEVSDKIDRIGLSNEHRNSREHSLSKTISEYQGELKKLSTTWQSIPRLASKLEEFRIQYNEDGDLAIAFHRISLQLRDFIWLLIVKLQKSLQEVLLIPFFAALYQKFLIGAKRIPLLMIGDRFSFEDALGRTQLLSCADFQSWKIFRAFLEISFEGLLGFSYVVQSRFEIMNAFNGAVINESFWRAILQLKTKLIVAVILAVKLKGPGYCPTENCTGKVSFS